MKTVRILALILLTGSMAYAQAPQPAAQGQRGGGQQRQADPRDMGGGQCAENVWNCKDTPNPLALHDSVWMEELTWMEVRDAIKLGKDTAIIATGGMEPNGPFLVTGKHNYVLRSNCEAIARKMGTALCAPLVKFVPEGSIDPPSGHMRSPGTISLQQSTYEALLTDIAQSLKMHGFKNIIFIGDSGGNGTGMSRVAEALNAKFPETTFAHVAGHYSGTGGYGAAGRFLETLGIEEGESDNLHDDIGITLNMFVTDPDSVRWDARMKAGLARINGVDISDYDKMLEIGKKFVDFRATMTVESIKKAIETKGASTVAARRQQQ